MTIWEIIARLVVLLTAAFVLGAAAQRLRQSAIVGYLVAGTVLGSTLFDREVLLPWGEIGVSLLLFSIGLEFSFGRLRRMGAVALAGGGLQVAVTLALFAALFAFRHPLGASIAWGEIVAVSSTAIVLRMLADRAEMDSVTGRTALGILLAQDVAVVPLVLALSVLSHGGAGWGVFAQLGRSVAAAGGLVAVFYLLFYRLIPRLLMRGGVFADRELVVVLAIVIALGSAWAAHSLGLSPALGAFLAGMLLAESPFASQIRADVGSLRTIFVTLFFTAVGMLAEPAWFAANWAEVLGWLGLVFVGKALVIFAIGVAFRLHPTHALATGIALAQVGEFSFVLAAEARRGGLITDHVFSLAVSVTILSMLLTPYMVTYARPAARGIVAALSRRKTLVPDDGNPAPEHEGRVFIVGFGPAGRKVARALVENGVVPHVVELNPASVKAAMRMGLEVHVGDASQPEIIAHLGIDQACVVVLTVPDPNTARRILQNIHGRSPGTSVIVRSRYHIATAELWGLGAAFVVDEENVVGREL
ncbi:MAG TPA: cation:proton antiporter, partial [Desulfobacterales bacterium]|nr:cation:proton antiporter [Desulfobacterales bacterium]